MKKEHDPSLVHKAKRFPELLAEIRLGEAVVEAMPNEMIADNSQIPYDAQFLRGMNKCAFSIFVSLKKAGAIYEKPIDTVVK